MVFNLLKKILICNSSLIFEFIDSRQMYIFDYEWFIQVMYI